MQFITEKIILSSPICFVVSRLPCIMVISSSADVALYSKRRLVQADSRSVSCASTAWCFIPGQGVTTIISPGSPKQHLERTSVVSSMSKTNWRISTSIESQVSIFLDRLYTAKWPKRKKALLCALFCTLMQPFWEIWFSIHLALRIILVPPAGEHTRYAFYPHWGDACSNHAVLVEPLSVIKISLPIAFQLFVFQSNSVVQCGKGLFFSTEEADGLSYKKEFKKKCMEKVVEPNRF